ncbi:hypothetical protein F4804DRAFT_296920 [Jackrogersella minutella]|nr:hypothetical protein F4804DRAFT_296920 [Jackrogersella minutella]
MAEVPVIQILDKKNYFKQALVPLPNALPLPPLGESSLRVRTEVLCVTSNNFSYCRHGETFGWLDVHPIPPSTPAPYSDTSTYGRINCWGYLPIGTLPQDFQVKQGNVPNQFIVTEPYHQKQLPVYNRYMVFPETLSKEIEARSDGFEGMFKSCEGLRKDGFKGFRVNWGEGMEAVKEGWDRFARNEAQADEGLVFKL